MKALYYNEQKGHNSIKIGEFQGLAGQFPLSKH